MNSISIIINKKNNYTIEKYIRLNLLKIYYFFKKKNYKKQKKKYKNYKN